MTSANRVTNGTGSPAGIVLVDGHAFCDLAPSGRRVRDSASPRPIEFDRARPAVGDDRGEVIALVNEGVPFAAPGGGICRVTFDLKK